MKARVIALLMLIAFTATLAVIIGNRVSADSLAMLVGVICGMGASVPISILALWLTRRSSRRDETDYARQHTYPPVVVINPATTTAQQRPSSAYYTPPMLEQGTSRRFTIVGDEESICEGHHR